MDLSYLGESSTHESFLKPEDTGNSQEIPLSHSITASRLFNLAVTVDRYYTPVLCLFGSIGNCLSIIVFFSKSHNARTQSSSVYLSSLAISDTFFLTTVFIMWLDHMGVSLMTNSFMCKTVMYFAQVFSMLSVWFIVAFTVERCLVVCYPLFKSSKCTASRAKKIAMSLTIFAVIAFSYIWVIAEVQPFKLHGSNATKAKLVSTETHQSFFDQTTLPPIPENRLQKPPEIKSFIENHVSFNGNYWDDEFQSDEEMGTLVQDDQNKDPWRGAIFNDNNDENEPVAEFVYMCSVPEKYHDISRVNSYIDSVLTFIVPFALISVLNMKIILCINKIKHHRESMLATTKIQYHKKGHHKKRQETTSQTENKDKMKDCFCTSRYMKNSAGPRKDDKKQRKTKESTASTGKLSSSNLKASGSSRQPQKYQSGQMDKRNGVMTSLLEEIPNVESDSPSSPDSVIPPFKPSTATLTANDIRVAKTLVLVSSVFLLLHFPSHMIRVAAFIESIGSGSKDTLQMLNVAQHWSNILFNTNFAINFLLYCCSGKAFRRSLKNLFTKEFIFGKNQTRHASTTVLTTQLTLHTDPASSKYNTRILRRQSGTGLEEYHQEEDQL